MAIGIREEPENKLSTQIAPKRFKRKSRKWLKKMQNRKDRHLANINPETVKRPKYKGWEW